jgi:hypothetical protein
VYNISQADNSDLKTRILFLGLDDNGRETLRRLGPLIRQNIGAALDIVYDKVRKVPETAAFFRSDDHIKSAKNRQEADWGIVGTADFTEAMSRVSRRSERPMPVLVSNHAGISAVTRWSLNSLSMRSPASADRAVLADVAPSSWLKKFQ